MARRKKDFKTMHPYLKYYEMMMLEFKLREQIERQARFCKAINDLPCAMTDALKTMRAQQRYMKIAMDLLHTEYKIGEDWMEWMHEYGKTGKIPEQVN